MIMRVISSRETLAPLRFDSLKKDDLIAYLVGDETVQKSKHLPEEHIKAALLSTDGLGDFAISMCGVGIYNTVLTQYLGFWKYRDEYKVMGLPAYGEAHYVIGSSAG